MAVGLDFRLPFHPSAVMLAVEFEPPLFPRGGRNSVFIQGRRRAQIVDGRLIVECFKLKGLFDGEADQNAMTIAINEISSR